MGIPGLCAAWVLLSGSDGAQARERAMAREVTIVRDSYGVPHVHARTDAGAVFGGMYARAQDEMARIEAGHAPSIGMASQMYGEAGVTTDRFILSFEVPDLARRECEAAPADVRALAQAGADALNYYQRLHPEYRPRVIERWEPWMFFAREYAWALYQVQSDLQRLGRELGAGNDGAAVPAPDGSNAWAISGSRTASGRPMLYINPHIPLDEPYELELRSDEGLHVMGLVAYGAGLLPMAAYNDHLGWSLTVNYPDIADTYAVRFDVPGDDLAYRFGGQTLRATRWTARVRVRDGDERELTLARTVHGPLLYSAGGVSYAARAVKIENLRALEQWYRMARARNLDEWKQAVSIFGVVFHNFVYADAAGNIGYVYNAAFPVRDPALDWSGTLDGSDPRGLWTAYHALEDLPQVWNPRAGYIASCNSPPFTVTGEGENPVRGAFPRDMVGSDITDGRVAMSHDLLSHAAAWRLDDLAHAAFDTKVYSLERTRPSLLKDFDGVRASSKELGDRLAPAVELISAWDGRLSPDSQASSLFMVWAEKLFTPEWRGRRGAGDLSAALAEVMDEFERGFGTWRVAWGDLNRHQRFDSSAGVAVSDERESLPIAGGHGGLGVSFCYLARPASGARRYGYHGHSLVGAVEFTDRVEARTVIPFGQSRDPASPHYNDQAALYAAGSLKDSAFGRATGRAYHPGEEIEPVPAGDR